MHHCTSVYTNVPEVGTSVRLLLTLALTATRTNGRQDLPCDGIERVSGRLYPLYRRFVLWESCRIDHHLELELLANLCKCQGPLHYIAVGTRRGTMQCKRHAD